MSNFKVEFEGFNFNFGPLKEQIIIAAREELSNTQARIQKASEQGKDANGGSLRPYSAGYREQIKKGLVFGYDGTQKTKASPTTLRITNLLMNSMQIKNTPDGAELFFNGSHPTGHTRSGAARVRKTKKLINQLGKAKEGSKRHATLTAKLATVQSGQKKAKVASTGKKIGPPKKKTQAKPARKAASQGSIPNAELAQKLYGMGFTGWFEYGKEDLDRITKRAGDELDRWLNEAFAK